MAGKRRYNQHELDRNDAATTSANKIKDLQWTNKFFFVLTVLGMTGAFSVMHYYSWDLNTSIFATQQTGRNFNLRRSVPISSPTYRNQSGPTTMAMRPQISKRPNQEINFKPKSTVTETTPVRYTATKLPNNQVSFKPNLARPTSARFSRVILVSTKPYQISDTLEISIEAYDIKRKPKQYGGDYFWVWISNSELLASAAADEIIDHDNGTYTARFRLHWSGNVTIAVYLIHSSEAVSVIRRIRDTYPARHSYCGNFQSSNNISRLTSCHITPNMYIPLVNKTANMTFCNFTDEKTGFPWFCVKPEDVGCDAYVTHSACYEFGILFRGVMYSDVPNLLSRPKQVSSTIHSIFVNDSDNETASLCRSNRLPQCIMGLEPRAPNSSSGFYFQDHWNSLICQNRKFTASVVRKCLRHKRLHFWGDSTLRQWYEFFARTMRKVLKQEIGQNKKFGPHVAFDKRYNITFYYRHHAYPVRSSLVPVSDIRYVPNMIDEIPRGSDEIVLLSLWAHFTATNIDYYRQRWQSIKESLARLKKRSPKTRIIIKSANTREPVNSDLLSWYAWELDKVMRQMMSGVDGVQIIDVWDMTMGHRTGFHIHPRRDVISQETDMLLSYLCTDI